MKFEDDDLKDGKLWAALQKEIDQIGRAHV